MGHSDYIVYVDESGDHSLESIDPDWPVFVLSFCIFRKDDYARAAAPALRELKFATFGHDMVVLHEHDIRRKKGAFSVLNKERRDAFMAELSNIIAATNVTIIAVVIDKAKLKAKYTRPSHPYYLAMQWGLERVYRFMMQHGQSENLTCVVCEARGAKEDAALELEFRRVCSGEGRPGPAYPFEIVIADKKTNSEGLQLADLTARPIGLRALRPEQMNRAWDTIEPKLYLGMAGATIHGNGFKVFP